jgi:hypothetical protein
MDVRIEKQTAVEVTIILISGELKGQGIFELDRICHETEGALSLDLGNLRSVGEEGILLLRTLVARGAALTGVNPYLGLLLEVESPESSEI